MLKDLFLLILKLDKTCVAFTDLPKLNKLRNSETIKSKFILTARGLPGRENRNAFLWWLKIQGLPGLIFIYLKIIFVFFSINFEMKSLLLEDAPPELMIKSNFIIFFL